MPDIDLLIVLAALALGGFTFLRLLAVARKAVLCAAMMEPRPTTHPAHGRDDKAALDAVTEVGG